MLLKECSTVKDALTSSEVGLGGDGVSSMHDATEGGVLGGLSEMADASHKAFCIEEERVHVPKVVGAVCGAVGIDPLSTVSEGCLLLTCGPKRVGELARRLRRNGIPSFEIGEVRSGRGLWVSRGGAKARRTQPRKDSYWSVYEGFALSGSARSTRVSGKLN